MKKKLKQYFVFCINKLVEITIQFAMTRKNTWLIDCLTSKSPTMKSYHYQLTNPRIDNIAPTSYMELKSIVVAELIPVERIQALKAGLLKLLYKHPRRPGGTYYQEDYLNEYISRKKSGLTRGAWAVVGDYRFLKTNPLEKYIDSVEIELSDISSSIALLTFKLEITKLFNEILLDIYDADIKDKPKLIPPQYDSILNFRRWGVQGAFPEKIKAEQVADKLSNLKKHFLSQINQYIPCYFKGKTVSPPSLEIYKTNNGACDLMLRYHDIGKVPYYYDADKNEAWTLFQTMTIYPDDNEYPRFKLICNTANVTEDEKKGYSNDDDYYILYGNQEFVRSIIPGIALDSFLHCFEKKLNAHSNYVYKKIENKLKSNEMLRFKFNLQKEANLITRFYNELTDKDFKDLIKKIKRSSHFARQSSGGEEIPFLYERIVEHVKSDIVSLYNQQEQLNATIDKHIDILLIQSNRRHQSVLTILTFILAIIAVSTIARQYIAGLYALLVDSLYLLIGVE